MNEGMLWEELDSSLRLYPVAYVDDDVEVVVLNQVSFSISGSCRRFFDNSSGRGCEDSSGGGEIKPDRPGLWDFFWHALRQEC